MSFPFLSEGDIEGILAKHSVLIENELTLLGRQVSVGRVRIDLLLRDKFRDTLAIEVKCGTIKREHVGQIMEYSGTLYDGKPVRLMLIGNRVPPAFRNSLEYHGIEWREISTEQLAEFLRANDPELLEQLVGKKSPSIPRPELKPPVSLLDAETLFQQFQKLSDFVAGEGIKETSVDTWHRARKEAKEKYARLFRSDHLKDLTAEAFESFLYFKNNRGWTNLYRRGKAVIGSMNALRQAITYLQDETEDVRKRINLVLLGGRLHVDGFGKNLATSILHVCDERDKYGVWNNRTEGGLRKLGRLPRRSYNNGEFYERINMELNGLKRELGTDLIMIDGFMWFVDKEF